HQLATRTAKVRRQLKTRAAEIRVQSNTASNCYRRSGNRAEEPQVPGERRLLTRSRGQNQRAGGTASGYAGPSGAPRRSYAETIIPLGRENRVRSRRGTCGRNASSNYGREPCFKKASRGYEGSDQVLFSLSRRPA